MDPITGTTSKLTRSRQAAIHSSSKRGWQVHRVLGHAAGAERPDTTRHVAGRPYPLSASSVDRVGEGYGFVPGGKSLMMKLGGFRRQDFWSVDLATGRRRALTALKPGESVQRFDVSPDGKWTLFERMRENSDVVLIEPAPQ